MKRCHKHYYDRDKIIKNLEYVYVYVYCSNYKNTTIPPTSDASTTLNFIVRLCHLQELDLHHCHKSSGEELHIPES